jgi:hypothetical protein
LCDSDANVHCDVLVLLLVITNCRIAGDRRLHGTGQTIFKPALKIFFGFMATIWAANA